MGWWRDRRVLVAAATAYVLALVLLVGGPWGHGLNRLTVRLYVFFRYDWPIAPDGALPEHYGVLLNVVLFVPLGVVGVVLLRRSWWAVTLAAAALSAAIEVVQWLFLDREGSWVDVAANTVGALLGALLGAALSPRARRR